MTATDTIRAMLDERGVEWETNDRYTDRWLTRWKSNGIEWSAEEEGMALLLKTVDGIEPEQAIEATLGSDLKAENEKLRELVRELYDELDAATQYDAGGGRGVLYEFADRMRELGVEV